MIPRIGEAVPDAELRTADGGTCQMSEVITAPTLLSIGLRDDICPPQTGYALYNRLSCPKELKVYPDAAHEGGGFVHAQLKTAWLGQQLKP